MSAPDLTSELMDSFRDSGASSHSTILLGAGASITSGLPDWDTFATRLLTQSNAVESTESARLLLSRQDPLIVVEAARIAFGNRWESKLRLALYEGTQEPDMLDPSPLHLASVGHYLSSRRDTTLVTLNFDNLLEKALEAETGEPPIPRTRKAIPAGSHHVHHLHGIITPSEARDVILTLTDFSELIEDTAAWQVEFLRTAVKRGALFIAGTSYRDPDLRQWLYKALQHKPAEHSAFVLLAREGFSVSKEEFQRIQNALSNQWSAVGLRPVLLQDHSDAAQIISELRHINSENYQSPQERCLDVWEAHSRQFTTLQEFYVDELIDDTRAIRESFDTETLSLTLWISDGAGHLIRWASQDRIYRDISALRRVESGHDSPWIAGQCLSADSLLFKNLQPTETQRWKSVLAMPIPVIHPRHPHLPALSSAVLTIALPGTEDQYEKLTPIWGHALTDIGRKWEELLSASIHTEPEGTIGSHQSGGML